MTLQFVPQLARIRVPQAKRLIRAVTKNRFSVGRKDALALVAVSLELVQLFTRFKVIKMDDVVVAAGQAALTVRRNRHGDGACTRTGELADKLARGYVPEIQIAIAAVPAEELFAVRQEKPAAQPRLALRNELPEQLAGGDLPHADIALGSTI